MKSKTLVKLIEELREKAEYLTDENYHSEARLFYEIAEIVETNANNDDALIKIVKAISEFSFY
jgi:hypothetical protein